MSCLGFLLVAIVFGLAESHFFPPPHGPYGPLGPHGPLGPIFHPGSPIFPPRLFNGPIIQKPIFHRPFPVLKTFPVHKPVPFVKRVPLVQNLPVLRPYPVFRQIVVPKPVMVPIVKEVQVPRPIPRPFPIPNPVPLQVHDQKVQVAPGPGAVAGGANTNSIIVSDADHVNMASSVAMDSQASNVIISDADHVTFDNLSTGRGINQGSSAAGIANLGNTGGVDLSDLAGSIPGFNFGGGNLEIQAQAGQQNGALVGSPLAVISFDAANGLPDGAFSGNFIDLGIGHGNGGGVGFDLGGHGIGGGHAGIGIDVNGGGQGVGVGQNGVSIDLAGHGVDGGLGGIGVDGHGVGGVLDVGHGPGSNAGGNTAVDIHLGDGRQHGRSHGNQVGHV